MFKRILIYLTALAGAIAIFTGCSVTVEAPEATDQTTTITVEATTSVPDSTTKSAEDTTTEVTVEESTAATTVTEATTESPAISEDGIYTTCDDVALFIYTYGTLPQNFMTKREARALGWEGGSLEPYAPGMCIGGDYFGNYEGLLPEADGREYHECDIDTLGASSRGAKRIIYSNDGLIYYTSDHYESFTLLYGEE